MASSTHLTLGSVQLILEPLGCLLQLEERVSSAEWGESMHFGGDHRRREWLTSRAILRGELKERGIAVDDVDFIVEYDSCGAPSIARALNCSLFISISHTSDCVAVALSTHPTAIDIEVLSRRVKHLLPRFASQREIDILDSKAINPIILWSIKEALYKSAGRNALSFRDDLVVNSINETGCDALSADCTITPNINIPLKICTIEGYAVVVAGAVKSF